MRSQAVRNSVDFLATTHKQRVWCVYGPHTHHTRARVSPQHWECWWEWWCPGGSRPRPGLVHRSAPVEQTWRRWINVPQGARSDWGLENKSTASTLSSPRIGWLTSVSHFTQAEQLNLEHFRDIYSFFKWSLLPLKKTTSSAQPGKWKKKHPLIVINHKNQIFS